MEREAYNNENQELRLRWLMLSRVAIVSFLLGIAAFIQVKGTESLSPVSLYSVYLLIGITYFLSLFYAYLLNKNNNIEFNVNIQSLFDIVLITVLVFVTGGIESIYSMLYPLVIIYSVLFLGKRGGILIASTGGILYGLLIDLEFYNVIQPIYNVGHIYNSSAGYVFARIFIYIVSFYIIAILTSYLVEKEKTARVLLSEKESAFDQLDLLHRSIIESIDAGIMTIDLQGFIKSFNRAAERITGFSFSEIRNKNIGEILKNLIDIIDGESEEGGDSVWGADRKPQKRYETTITAKDGHPVILGFSHSNLMDGKSKKIGQILIFQDLTSKKEMEREVEKNKRLAFIGEMSAVLAHELRNPLASLSGSIQILQRDLELEGTDQKLMDIILRGKDQLENLAKDFLLLARPNPGNRTTINVKKIIHTIVESDRCGPDWNDPITIEEEWGDWNNVYGNEVEIRQALGNIVMNALQSMPEGGILKIKTDTLVTQDKEFLQINIEDTGIGIGKEHHDKILEPFYTTKETGTGLGLAIVNRVIESHGGNFTIDSKLNEGTQCIILLPIDSDRSS
ncbi:MAG: PAS domain S-box protein [Deltaproteobacteria bacterium]|nr:PAS domain S-box protein [Deltaproteobacteria bacterium]